MSDLSHSFSLREYLDVQFAAQNQLLGRIANDIEAGSLRLAQLGNAHHALDRVVATQELRIAALEAAAKDAADFRRKALFVGIPAVLTLVGYLVLQFFSTFVRNGLHP